MLEESRHYNCIAEDENGRLYKIHADQLRNKGMNHFLGWECDVGISRIFIDVDQTIWSGACHNTKLGEGTDWQLLDSPDICRRDKCSGCTDDLLIRKKIVLISA